MVLFLKIHYKLRAKVKNNHQNLAKTMQFLKNKHTTPVRSVLLKSRSS